MNVEQYNIQVFSEITNELLDYPVKARIPGTVRSGTIGGSRTGRCNKHVEN